jgi:hypothetical protein
MILLFYELLKGMELAIYYMEIEKTFPLVSIISSLKFI